MTSKFEDNLGKLADNLTSGEKYLEKPFVLQCFAIFPTCKNNAIAFYTASGMKMDVFPLCESLCTLWLILYFNHKEPRDTKIPQRKTPHFYPSAVYMRPNTATQMVRRQRQRGAFRAMLGRVP